MDKLLFARPNLGRVFNSRTGCSHKHKLVALLATGCDILISNLLCLSHGANVI